MAKNDGISNSLIGATIEKADHIPVNGPAWPVNEPNVSGQHIATIRAIWTDRDGSLKALAVTPFGTAFECYVTHHKVR